MIGHLEGICHIYVNKSANLNTAIQVIHNAKLRRTEICGAAETLLIDREYAKDNLEYCQFHYFYDPLFFYPLQKNS